MITPYLGLYSCKKISPMAAEEMMLGIMYTFRAIFHPLRCFDSARATRTAIGTWMTRPHSAQIQELRSASEK